jgi:hypothetical protein
MSAHGIRLIEGRVAHPPKGDSASALITRDRERVDGVACMTRGRAVASEKSRVQLDRLPAGVGCRPTYGRTWSSRKLFDPLLTPSAGSP